MNSYYVMLKFASSGSFSGTDVFSIHIDTARRGEVVSARSAHGACLRERGHQPVLVAHPDGELAARASGATTHPAGAKSRSRLACRLEAVRIIKDLRPDIVHAHDPHAVAVSALALSFITGGRCPGLMASRRVAFHLKGNAFSRWKYHQVDCFIAASNAINQMLVGDGIDPERIVTVYEGIDLQRVPAEPAANIHGEFWLPKDAPCHRCGWGAHAGERPQVFDRRCRTGSPRSSRRAIRDSGDGELRATLERQIKDLHLEKHVALPGFRPMSCRLSPRSISS